jgi:hypothetical protein
MDIWIIPVLRVCSYLNQGLSHPPCLHSRVSHFWQPTLIKIYTTHLLPLQEALRPSMRAFIICLLPGLEEETGEFFDQVCLGPSTCDRNTEHARKILGLLDRLSGVVSPAFFFQNIWLILLTTPTARGTALNLLSRRLPRMKPDEGCFSAT